MSKKFTPDAECRAAANAASDDLLTPDEIDAAFQTISDYKQRLQAEGDISGMGDKLRSFAAQQAERTRLAAVLKKRHAALNILIKDRQNEALDSLIKSGLTPRKAILAIMEGTQAGVEGGRNSVGALNMAYEARYMGEMLADLQREAPHLVIALRDPKLDADITREMMQLGKNGNPGVTGNKDAMLVAKVFAAHAERARTDLNSLGASIGKLDGWAGVQQHDDIRMLAAGKDAWVSSVRDKLDIERTFGMGVNVDDLLGKLYNEFITGFPADEVDLVAGQRVNPANLAKALGQSRVLHFKDAEAALAYRDEFGYGNTVSGMFSYFRQAARSAALMESLGPNPEMMFRNLVDGLKARVADDMSLDDGQKVKWVKELDAEGGALKQSIDVATGLYSRPVNVQAARIAQDIRAVQSMAKLGGSVLSSVSDTTTAALASMFRGSGFFKGLAAQLDGLRRGRPKGEVAEVSYIIGEGFDGILGHIVAPAAAVDGPVGRMAKLQEAFFRWNGQSWWTDVNRASAGRMIAAEMGMRTAAAFEALPANYRHVLGLHGIDAARWEAIRKSGVREVEGKTYVTPDLIRNLSDEDIAPFVKLDLGDNPAARAAKIADAKRGLELSVLRFFADETSYGVLETDAASRRFTTQGLRPGTAAGEAIRFVMQFKGFPTAFTQRVLGRAIYGHRKDATFLDRSAHIGALLAGMGMAGYMSMTMKDMMRGYWPPRDPTDTKTWAAALVQGGAMGLYGDFLFAQTNRFGGGVLDTLAGPTVGSAADAIELGLKARENAEAALAGEEGKNIAANALSLAVNNTPFVNLFWTRPAIDFLFLNSMREAASPGYLKRQATTRKKDYGQQRLDPLGTGPTLLN